MCCTEGCGGRVTHCAHQHGDNLMLLICTQCASYAEGSGIHVWRLDKK